MNFLKIFRRLLRDDISVSPKWEKEEEEFIFEKKEKNISQWKSRDTMIWQEEAAP